MRGESTKIVHISRCEHSKIVAVEHESCIPGVFTRILPVLNSHVGSVSLPHRYRIVLHDLDETCTLFIGKGKGIPLKKYPVAGIVRVQLP